MRFVYTIRRFTGNRHAMITLRERQRAPGCVSRYSAPLNRSHRCTAKIVFDKGRVWHSNLVRYAGCERSPSGTLCSARESYKSKYRSNIVCPAFSSGLRRPDRSPNQSIKTKHTTPPSHGPLGIRNCRYELSGSRQTQQGFDSEAVHSSCTLR